MSLNKVYILSTNGCPGLDIGTSWVPLQFLWEGDSCLLVLKRVWGSRKGPGISRPFLTENVPFIDGSAFAQLTVVDDFSTPIDR